jgi:hypothetical protein
MFKDNGKRVCDSEFSWVCERSFACHSGRLNTVNNVLQFSARSELVTSVVASLQIRAVLCPRQLVLVCAQTAQLWVRSVDT